MIRIFGVNERITNVRNKQPVFCGEPEGRAPVCTLTGRKKAFAQGSDEHYCEPCQI
jgi:hypothetical protein